MPTFEEFVQTELPLRPFVSTDGAAGQILVRSSNPMAPRQLEWANISGATPQNEINLEAGEDLVAGTPVKVVANKFYAASHATDPHIVGIIQADKLATFNATAVTSGPIAIAGLTPGSAYFLGVNTITSTAPSSGYVVRLGTAVTASVLLVNIEEPILLS